MTNGRNENGRFSTGNPGGPGRPRRAIELDYLAALGEAVTLPAWQRIVARALADAEAGDPRARDWITKYVIGESPARLIDLAAREQREVTSADEISALADEQASDAKWAAQTRNIIEKLATS
ncbi:hypothetical protein I41_47830 [Lacipirellula limnantheis]|uniref:Uncharacterized protein n=1 Tax=Lacipirellula limnantheis TaxID=2528024 RepID=A0A517U4L2_9BACT|nr:hypothetical protein I41_47830 [Lacipirellula limnantheis]